MGWTRHVTVEKIVSLQLWYSTILYLDYECGEGDDAINHENSVKCVIPSSSMLFSTAWTVRARTNHAVTSGSELSERGIIRLVCFN